MVIVDPDRVVLFRDFKDRVGEFSVDLTVMIGPCGFEATSLCHVVEEGPQGGVGIALVESIDSSPLRKTGRICSLAMASRWAGGFGVFSSEVPDQPTQYCGVSDSMAARAEASPPVVRLG